MTQLPLPQGLRCFVRSTIHFDEPMGYFAELPISFVRAGA
jgi:hypothetical protein